MTVPDEPPRLRQPHLLPGDHWEAIAAEQQRLYAALARQDWTDVIGCCKCLVESIARATLDVAGEPAENSTDFTQTVTRAHNLLKCQPGEELTDATAFVRIAEQSKKAALQLGSIRNELGTGHGRARVPQIDYEAVALSLDASHLWARWALRRLEQLCLGRPGSLIEDLHSSIFKRGALTKRLVAADVPALQVPHQRAIGAAVGQRAASGTFTVMDDGVEACIASDKLDPWTVNYRWGVAQGLLIALDGRPTLTPGNVRIAIELLDAIPDRVPILSELIPNIIETARANAMTFTSDHWSEILHMIVHRMDVYPDSELVYWWQLLDLLEGKL